MTSAGVHANMEKSTSLKDERMSRELVTIGYPYPQKSAAGLTT